MGLTIKLFLLAAIVGTSLEAATSSKIQSRAVCDADCFPNPDMGAAAEYFISQAFQEYPSNKCKVAAYIADQMQIMFGGAWMAYVDAGRLYTSSKVGISLDTTPGNRAVFTYLKHDILISQAICIEPSPQPDESLGKSLRGEIAVNQSVTDVSKPLEIKFGIKLSELYEKYESYSRKYQLVAQDMHEFVRGYCGGNWWVLTANDNTFQKNTKFCLQHSYYKNTRYSAMYEDVDDIYLFSPKCDY